MRIYKSLEKTNGHCTGTVTGTVWALYGHCRGPKKVTRTPDSTANQKYSGHRNLGPPELLSSKPKKHKLNDRSAQFKELRSLVGEQKWPN